MKIKQNNARLISSEEVTVIKTHEVEVLIERNDSTNVMTTWSMHITYIYDQWDSGELAFNNAFVIDNATGRKLHEVTLSEEEFATIEEYILLEYNID